MNGAPPGFEPKFFSLQGKRVDWGRFELWLLRGHRRRVRGACCLMRGSLVVVCLRVIWVMLRCFAMYVSLLPITSCINVSSKVSW